MHQLGWAPNHQDELITASFGTHGSQQQHIGVYGIKTRTESRKTWIEVVLPTRELFSNAQPRRLGFLFLFVLEASVPVITSWCGNC